jgi:hypothetical protein
MRKAELHLNDARDSRDDAWEQPASAQPANIMDQITTFHGDARNESGSR